MPMSLRQQLADRLYGTMPPFSDPLTEELLDEVIRQMEWARYKAQDDAEQAVGPEHAYIIDGFTDPLTIAPEDWTP